MLEDLIQEIEGLQKNTAFLVAVLYQAGGSITLKKKVFNDISELPVAIVTKPDGEDIKISLERELLN